MKILFVEPPKEFWFVMGEYLPPPLGILQLAGYLEQNNNNPISFFRQIFFFFWY